MYVSNWDVYLSEPDGLLRLVGGTTENEGRIEIFHNGEWGTVCDDSWDMADGEVACHQLGYPGADMTYIRAEFGLGNGRIWLDDMQCIGTEKTLPDCSHSWIHNCDHSEDAGLKCTLAAGKPYMRPKFSLSHLTFILLVTRSPCQYNRVNSILNF